MTTNPPDGQHLLYSPILHDDGRVNQAGRYSLEPENPNMRKPSKLRRGHVHFLPLIGNHTPIDLTKAHNLLLDKINVPKKIKKNRPQSIPTRKLKEGAAGVELNIELLLSSPPHSQNFFKPLPDDAQDPEPPTSSSDSD